MFRRLICLCFAAVAVSNVGCSTVPKADDQALFLRSTETAESYFVQNVTGLRRQLNNSAAYIVFPEVGQWGILIAGGKFGRGVVRDAGGKQIGWAAINTGSVGLQAGVQGMKMLMVLQDQMTLLEFKANRLTGSVSAVAVAGDSGESGAASFDRGVAVYQGAQTGLMAGANIGLDWIRFEPM